MGQARRRTQAYVNKVNRSAVPLERILSNILLLWDASARW